MNKSKVFGSTLIIAGTTIGAGMLALPLASAGIGFSTSLFLMLGLWALMAFTALLMVELSPIRESDATLQYHSAHTILGTKGKWIASFAVMFLFYALCAAYIAGGAQFNQRISDIAGIELNGQVNTLLFTLLS